MNIPNWIPLVSALIIAVGWYVTAYLNRRKDVAEKRLEHRLVALKSFLPVWFMLQKRISQLRKSENPALVPMDPKFSPLLEEARSNFQLYGYPDEIEPLETFIQACENGEQEQMRAALSILVTLVKDRIRKELEIV